MLLYFKFEFIYCIYLYIYIRLTTLYQHTYDVSVYTSLLALYSSLDERNKPTNIHREREREEKTKQFPKAESKKHQKTFLRWKINSRRKAKKSAALAYDWCFFWQGPGTDETEDGNGKKVAVRWFGSSDDPLARLEGVKSVHRDLSGWVFLFLRLILTFIWSF